MDAVDEGVPVKKRGTARLCISTAFPLQSTYYELGNFATTSRVDPSRRTLSGSHVPRRLPADDFDQFADLAGRHPGCRQDDVSGLQPAAAATLSIATDSIRMPPSCGARLTPRRGRHVASSVSGSAATPKTASRKGRFQVGAGAVGGPGEEDDAVLDAEGVQLVGDAVAVFQVAAADDAYRQGCLCSTPGEEKGRTA